MSLCLCMFVRVRVLSKIKSCICVCYQANSVSDGELKKLLFPRGSIKSNIGTILPLLEFVTWSLLAEDTEVCECECLYL